jgi:hypothetical protein
MTSDTSDATREYGPTALSETDLDAAFVGGSVAVRDGEGGLALFLGDEPVDPVLDSLDETGLAPDDADLLVARGTGRAAAANLDRVLTRGTDWSETDVRHPDARPSRTAFDAASLARRAVADGASAREAVAGAVDRVRSVLGGDETSEAAAPDASGRFGPVLDDHGVDGETLTAGDRVDLPGADVVALNGRGSAVVPEVVSGAGDHSLLLAGAATGAEEAAAWNRRRALNTDWTHYADHDAVAAVEHPCDGASAFLARGRAAESPGVVFNGADPVDVGTSETVDEAETAFVAWTGDEGQGPVRVGLTDGDETVQFTAAESVRATAEAVWVAGLDEPTPDEASPLVDAVEHDDEVTTVDEAEDTEVRSP